MAPACTFGTHSYLFSIEKHLHQNNKSKVTHYQSIIVISYDLVSASKTLVVRDSASYQLPSPRL